MILRFIALLLLHEIVQQPGPAEPFAEEILDCLAVTPSGNDPVTGHGGVVVVDGETPRVDGGAVIDGAMGETNVVDTGGNGLRPGLASSVEPRGMLAGPACNVDRWGIDEPVLSAPAPPAVAPLAPAQLLDAPAMPPPSNCAVVGCDVDPPGLEQPMVAGGAGLVPGAASSVAPSGTPVEPTGAPFPKVRGVVGASGCVPIAPTWARVEPQLRRAAAKVAVAKRIFMARPSIDVNSM
jgi:hypothetical protein